MVFKVTILKVNIVTKQHYCLHLISDIVIENCLWRFLKRQRAI